VTTPLRRQYLDIKKRYPHAILFFRMGDFYETFDEDAETVARELEITLTTRPVSKGERVPLAGIPYHALDSYLGKLIAKGYKVAICEQTEPPQKGKKIVDRRVVRVVTPGTLVEDNLLQSGANNYLAAIAPANGVAGLAYVDVSTGEFACMQLPGEDAAAELERLRPTELLIPKGTQAADGLTATLTPLPREAFAPGEAVRTLLAHFEAASLDALDLGGKELAATAAGVILSYLRDNQPAALGHIVRLARHQGGGHMAIDSNTRRNLELFHSLSPQGDGLTLLAVLDETKTPLGARLLRRWVGQPLLDITPISGRQDGVQLFFDSAVRRSKTAATLAKIPDIERSLGRVSTAAAGSLNTTTPRDLVAIRRALELVPALREAVEYDPASTAGKQTAAEDLIAGLHPCAEALELLSQAIADDPKDGEAIRPGFSEELDRLRSTARDARQYLAELEMRERERTGIKSLKVGYNKVFGYYIEVSKANAASVPDDYQRRQTLVGGERYTTPELKEYEDRVLNAHELREELESQLLRQVCSQVAAHGPRILETASAIALTDVYCGLAGAAARYDYVRPTVDDGDGIIIRDGRHPVVERIVPDGAFVPNDTRLSTSDEQIVLLTGPNMAGKSTYLRQIALIVLMAQIGSFVPAKEARIGVVDRIFSRVGALDDISAGRSTFMVEMLETANILHNATPRSLLIFDEIGRGTSTYDGMAIARAVVEFVHSQPAAAAKTLFATHYHELTDLANHLPRVRNYNVAVAEEGGGIVFLHRILPGGADRSYGVHVAQLAGLPKPVVLRAQEILEELEASRANPLRAPRTESAAQMSLFQQDDGLARELSSLDPDSMTPLQAMMKLYELVERARTER
jgi:DNA mismatch repair protein MutS